MKKLVAGLALAACLGVSPVSWTGISPAWERAEAADVIQDSDFGYKGLMLGDAVSQMRDILGEPLYDKDQTVQGVPLTVYEYPEAQVGVAKATGRVVDIALSGRDYRLRRGVKYGATSYYLQKVYGKTKRVWRAGVPCFIYTRKDHDHMHLLFELDSGDWTLVKTRITTMPLTEDEAERMAIEDADVEAGLEAAGIEERDIDVSSLPAADEPRLRMGGQAG